MLVENIYSTFLPGETIPGADTVIFYFDFDFNFYIYQLFRYSIIKKEFLGKLSTH